MVIVCPSPKSPANTATPPLVMCVNGNCDAVRLYCYPSSSTQVHVRRASVAGAELLICSTTLSLSLGTHTLFHVTVTLLYSNCLSSLVSPPIARIIFSLRYDTAVLITTIIKRCEYRYVDKAILYAAIHTPY